MGTCDFCFDNQVRASTRFVGPQEGTELLLREYREAWQYAGDTRPLDARVREGRLRYTREKIFTQRFRVAVHKAGFEVLRKSRDQRFCAANLTRRIGWLGC